MTRLISAAMSALPLTLSRLRISELKDLCIKYGLSTVGTSSALVERLRGCEVFREDCKKKGGKNPEKVKEVEELAATTAPPTPVTTPSQAPTTEDIPPAQSQQLPQAVVPQLPTKSPSCSAPAPAQPETSASSSSQTVAAPNIVTLLANPTNPMEQRIHRKQRFHEPLTEAEKRYLRSLRFSGSGPEKTPAGESGKKRDREQANRVNTPDEQQKTAKRQKQKPGNLSDKDATSAPQLEGPNSGRAAATDSLSRKPRNKIKRKRWQKTKKKDLN